MVWNFSWARPAGRELEVHALALATLPRGHRQFVKVLDAREATLATALLSAEHASLKVTMPRALAAVSTSSVPGRKWILLSVALTALAPLAWWRSRRLFPA